MPESSQKHGAEIFPEPFDHITQKAQAAVQGQTEARPVRRFRTILFQGYLILVVSAFAILAFLANTTAYFPIDVTITRFVQTGRATWFSDLMRFVSWFGFNPQAPVLATLIITFIFILGLRWEAVVATIAVVGDGAINFLAKLLIHRPRPSANIVDVFQQVSGYSFPSGHVMFYIGFFGFLFFLAFTLLKPSLVRGIILFLFAALIFLVGPSRVFLGEHWASDVLGAYLLGSLLLILEVQIYHWGKSRFFVRQPVAPPDSSDGQKS